MKISLTRLISVPFNYLKYLLNNSKLIIMATLSSNSVFGRISGKVGDRIYSSWKGISYVRAKAVRVSDAKTAAQLDHRAKFAVIIKFLQPLTVFLRVGFKSKNTTMSPFNAAMSYHLKNAITGTFPNYEIDYSKVRVSQGNLPGALNPQVQLTTTGEIEFTWENNSFETDSMADDKVLLVLSNCSKQHAVFVFDGNTRQSGSQVITLPENYAGDEIQCYIAFQNDRQTIFSDSQFVGSLMV